MLSTAMADGGNEGVNEMHPTCEGDEVQDRAGEENEEAFKEEEEEEEEEEEDEEEEDEDEATTTDEDDWLLLSGNDAIDPVRVSAAVAFLDSSNPPITQQTRPVIETPLAAIVDGTTNESGPDDSSLILGERLTSDSSGGVGDSCCLRGEKDLMTSTAPLANMQGLQSSALLTLATPCTEAPEACGLCTPLSPSVRSGANVSISREQVLGSSSDNPAGLITANYDEEDDEPGESRNPQEPDPRCMSPEVVLPRGAKAKVESDPVATERPGTALVIPVAGVPSTAHEKPVQGADSGARVDVVASVPPTPCEGADRQSVPLVDAVHRRQLRRASRLLPTLCAVLLVAAVVHLTVNLLSHVNHACRARHWHDEDADSNDGFHDKHGDNSRSHQRQPDHSCGERHGSLHDKGCQRGPWLIREANGSRS